VESLTSSSTTSDTRTNEEIAVSLGLNEEQLMECRHSNPQRAGLLLFSSLFPTYQDRANLVSIKEFSKKNAQLLDDMLGMLLSSSSSPHFERLSTKSILKNVLDLDIITFTCSIVMWGEHVSFEQ